MVLVSPWLSRYYRRMRYLVRADQNHAQWLSVIEVGGLCFHHLSFTLQYCISQMITMTTVWLLLLLVISSSQITDSQSTTDYETCSDRQILNVLERLIHNQQKLINRLGKYSYLKQWLTSLFWLVLRLGPKFGLSRKTKLKSEVTWCIFMCMYLFILLFL